MAYWKKFIWSIGLALVALTIVVLYRNSILDNNVLFAALAVSISLYLGILRIKLDNDRIFRELFTEFNNRYSNKTNDLLNKLRGDKIPNLSAEERLLLVDYFNLCAEEFLWYKKGRIPNDVWKAWKSGILENLMIPAVRTVYNEEVNSTLKEDSFYGLVSELKKSRNGKDSLNQASSQ